MTSETLEATLAALLARTGAQVARVLDGRTGSVLGEVGTAAAGDDLPALARLAVHAGAAAAGGGGLDDLVLATRSSVHLLRPTATPGSVLHLRLPAGRTDLAVARRALAAAARSGAGVGARSESAGRPELPAVPAPAATGQPALAALRPSPRLRTAELAVLALGPIAEARPSPRPRPAGEPRGSVVALPRRIPTQVVASMASPRALRPVDGPPAVLRQAWATDLDTLHRLLTALRRPTT